METGRTGPVVAVTVHGATMLPIVLIRGLGRCSEHWGSFPVRLSMATGREALCLDLPGFGSMRARSAPGRVEQAAMEVMESARFPRGGAHLLGLSLGGMVSCDIAQRMGEAAASLCLVNASSRPHAAAWERFKPGAWPMAARAMLGWESPRAGRGIEEAIHATTCTDVHGDRRRADVEQWERIRSLYPSRRIDVASQAWAAARWHAPSQPPTRKVMFLASTHDRIVDKGCSVRWADAWGADIHLHPHAGHDLPHDDPDWTLQRLVEFMHSEP